MPATPPRARLRRLARTAARATGWACAGGALLALAAYVATFCIPIPPALLRPPDTTLTLEDRAGREIAVVATDRARRPRRSRSQRWAAGCRR